MRVGCALQHGIGVAKDEAAGVRWYRLAADAGNSHAQYNLYVCYRNGLGGLRPDDPAGVAWLRKAVEGGCVDAQAELARCLRNGDGMPVDAAVANTWGLRAAEGGDTWMQADMGRRLLLGEGIPTDTVAGVALLRRAVDAGALSACLHLGDAHAAGLGGLSVDEAAARALYKRAAAGGDATEVRKARMKLHELSSSMGMFTRTTLSAQVPPVCGHAACGAALDAGTLSGLCAGCRAVRYCDAVCQRAAWATHRPACKAAVAARAASIAAAPPAASPVSPPTAPSAALAAEREEVEVWARMPLDTLRAAAEGGTAAAQGAIGVAHLDGTLGVVKDEEAGLGWLRKAAAQGLLLARFPLGTAALATADVPGANLSDVFAEACEWLRPLAVAGDTGAMYNACVSCDGLARVCGDDGKTSALIAEAGRWLRAAAAQSLPHALNTLGAAAWDGHPGMGVPRDRAEARRLFAAADAAGLPEEHRATRPAGTSSL